MKELDEELKKVHRKGVVLHKKGQTSVDVAHERCGVAALPFKAEERATGRTLADVAHKRCDVLAVQFEAEEKASVYKNMVEIRTRPEEKELVVEAGCEGSVVVETQLR